MAGSFLQYGNATLAEMIRMLYVIGKERQGSLEWLDMLASSCGVGLWDAVFHEGDSLHPEARWIWSAEFRRLLGFETEVDFPNVDRKSVV